MPQEEQHATELNHPEKVSRVTFPAATDPAKVLQPGGRWLCSSAQAINWKGAHGHVCAPFRRAQTLSLVLRVSRGPLGGHDYEHSTLDSLEIPVGFDRTWRADECKSGGSGQVWR